MKQVESDSKGKVRMGPGTLYGVFGRVFQAGLIRAGDRKADTTAGEPQRCL
jgi:DNA-binding PadR family transcriptional regulator